MAKWYWECQQRKIPKFNVTRQRYKIFIGKDLDKETTDVR